MDFFLLNIIKRIEFYFNFEKQIYIHDDAIQRVQTYTYWKKALLYQLAPERFSVTFNWPSAECTS